MGSVLALLVCFVFVFPVFAQKYTSARGSVSFFSTAPLENIQAENTTATSLFDASTAEIAFAVPVDQFQFKKKLMQEHFNDKYMESHKYPKSTFSGRLEGLDVNSQSVQQVTASGRLTIHGVTHEVQIPGTVVVRQDQLEMQSKFMVRLEDYKIRIPSIMWQNIAEEVEVTVNFVYKPK